MAGLTKKPLVPAFVRIAAASALASTVMACGDDEGSGSTGGMTNASDTAPEGPEQSDTGSATLPTDTSPEGPCPPEQCNPTTGGVESSTSDTGTDDATGTGTDTGTDTDASSSSGSTGSSTG